jgi:hypothetical protein
MAHYKLIEHLPVYASHKEAEEIEFNTTEELLDIDFVKAHSRQAGFYRYSIKHDPESIRTPLLAEYENGRKWIVIGFLYGKDLEKIKLDNWISLKVKIA